ncbi:vWA domain-containing protein [Dysgonomonas reticulitermitis]
MRRLPVYFLLDTSGSMNGEPIQALNNALSGMINSLRSDAQASETLWVSIITFDRLCCNGSQTGIFLHYRSK